VHETRKLACLAAVTVVLVLVLLALFSSRHHALQNQVDVSSPSSQRSAASAATLTPTTQNPVRLLIETPAGQISGADAAAYLALIKKAGAVAQAEIEKLCHSADEKERVVGAFLYLETASDVHGAVEALSKDHSPYVEAEVGRWLFLNQRFAEWQTFVKAKAASLSPSDFQAILSPLDMTTPGLQLAAGPTILGVGRDYADFVREVVRDNPELKAEVERQILSPSIDYNRQQALIPLLQAADHPTYQATILSLKAQTNPSASMYSRLTWLAQQQPLSQDQMNKLTDTVATAASGANGRLDSRTASALKAIAESSISSPNLTVDKASLQKGIAMLDSISPQDYSIKKTREELEYVLFSH
jgi:hypothetical protein